MVCVYVLYVVYAPMMAAIVGCGCSLHASLLNNERCIIYQHKHTLLHRSANVHDRHRAKRGYSHLPPCEALLHFTARTMEQKAIVFGQC